MIKDDKKALQLLVDTKETAAARKKQQYDEKVAKKERENDEKVAEKERKVAKRESTAAVGTDPTADAPVHVDKKAENAERKRLEKVAKDEKNAAQKVANDEKDAVDKVAKDAKAAEKKAAKTSPI